MELFLMIVGGVTICALAIVGLYELVTLLFPTVTGQAKTLPYRTSKIVSDIMADADARSRARQSRYDRLRRKDFEVQEAKTKVLLEKKEKALTKEQQKVEEVKEETQQEE